VKKTLIKIGLSLIIGFNSALANQVTWLNKDEIFIGIDNNAEQLHYFIYNIQQHISTPLIKPDGYQNYSLSYTGENILWFNESGFYFSSINKTPNKHYNIPRWIEPPNDMDAYEKQHLSFELAAAWLDDRYFLISQSYRFMGKSSCKLFDTQSKRWLTHIDNKTLICPEHGLYLSLKNLQKNLLLVTESTEGVLLNQLWRTNARAIELPRWNINGGYMRIYRDANSPDKLLIASPCTLKASDVFPAPLCKNIQGDAAETLFSYNIINQKIEIINRNLPAYAAINPYTSGSIAWLENNKICLKNSNKISCTKIE
jgi:hypothetical protein